MKSVSQPSGLHHGLAFLIDADWTPAQALAVFELINDLREQIWQHYALQIQAQLQQHHAAPRRRRGESILTDQLGHDHVARWRFVAY